MLLKIFLDYNFEVSFDYGKVMIFYFWWNIRKNYDIMHILKKKNIKKKLVKVKVITKKNSILKNFWNINICIYL